MRRPSAMGGLCWSRIIGLSIAIGLAPYIQANWLSSLTAPDIDIVAVTDMTDQGRVYPHASAEKPVYYMIVDAGERTFGRSWAGEKVPAPPVALKWMMGAMAQQGYRLADDAHPPTQLFVFGWGMIQGGESRPALHFLGGDKLDLKWEEQQYTGILSGHVLTTSRQLKLHGLAEKVWELAVNDLFLGVVRSYNIETATGGKPLLLWETRFGCPSRGLYMVDAMPLMIKVAAANLGRESKIPVNVDASDELHGHVELGELKSLGMEPDGSEHGAPSIENRKSKAK
jgi:hypothetical protein